VIDRSRAVITGSIRSRLTGQRSRRYPPRGYRAEQYEKWFPHTATAMRRWLSKLDPPKHSPDDSPDPNAAIGFLVSPWFSTPVPWYSMALACGLARRGRHVVVYWDDLGFPQRLLDEQRQAIAEVMAVISERVPVTRISSYGAESARGGDDELVDRLTALNTTWALRGGTVESDMEKAREREMHRALESTLPRVRSALRESGLESLVVPGGIAGTSGLYLAAASESSIRAATFDVDRGVAQICVDGIAAQSADIPRAFALLLEASTEVRARAICTARDEFALRARSTDSYGFQLVPSRTEPGEAFTAVIPMNVEWDSAALGRHIHFADTIEWITTTAAVILEAGGTVAVRQHPSERRQLQRSRLDMAAVLRDHFGDDNRVRFVAADDPTNSYDLLSQARVVLPFASTIGIEAAALGKTVIVAGWSCYASLGFVHNPVTRDDYLALVRRAVLTELPLLREQEDRAWLCYYLAAVRNRVVTDFTPSQDDFWQWCSRDPHTLFAEPEVADILEALDRDVPISLLRHHRATEEAHT